VILLLVLKKACSYLALAWTVWQAPQQRDSVQAAWSRPIWSKRPLFFFVDIAVPDKMLKRSARVSNVGTTFGLDLCAAAIR